MLFLIALVIALCGILPSWGGLLFDMFVDNRLIAGVALGLGAMVVAPLAGIWTVIAWGILDRRAVPRLGGHDDRPRPAPSGSSSSRPWASCW